MTVSLRTVGHVGLVNCLAFSACVLLQLFRLNRVKAAKSVYHRKLVLFLVLLCAGLAQLPLFVAFIVERRFNSTFYALQKLTTTCFLMGQALVMDEWCSVLYNNTQVQDRPWFLRRRVLIPLILLAITLVLSDIYVVAQVKDFSDFYSNWQYQLSIMVTFFCILSVAAMTLFTGLRLSYKITTLVKFNSTSSNHTASTGESAITPTTQGGAVSGDVQDDLEFQHQQQLALRTAANKLVFCMSILVLCMAIQTAVIVQSYYTSFKPSSSSETWVGMVFWTLWIWLPLWGGPGMLLVVSGIPSKDREGKLRDNRSDMPLLYDSRFSIQSTEDIARSFGSREHSMYMQPRSVSTHDSRLKEGSFYSRFDDSDTRLSSL